MAEIPRQVDNISSLRWEHYNDKGDTCTAAAWAHQRRLVTSKFSTQEVYPTYHQVAELYKTQNPIDPSKEEKIPIGGIEFTSNGGMNVSEMFTYLMTNKGPDGAQIVSVAEVKRQEVQVQEISQGSNGPETVTSAQLEAPTMQDVSEAIDTFGSVILEIFVLENNYSEKDNDGDDFTRKVPWTASANPRPKFGHSVLAGGYDLDAKTVKAVSWGQPITLTEQWWNTKVTWLGVKPLCHAAWIVVWPEQIGPDIEKLKAIYKRLTGQDMTLPTAS